jgi:hypothetical protein
VNPVIVGITLFDIVLATAIALAGFWAGRAMRTDLRTLRIRRGIMCFVLALLAFGLLELIGLTGWEDEALGAALTTVPLVFVSGASLVAGLFLLVCGPRKALS